MKAILDSSVLISAFLTPGRTPALLLAAGLAGRCTIVLSEQILAETARSLQYGPFPTVVSPAAISGQSGAPAGELPITVRSPGPRAAAMG